MQNPYPSSGSPEKLTVNSSCLGRQVIVDLYLPPSSFNPAELPLLLLNDGQNLPEIHFDKMLNALVESGQVAPLLCAGIHAGEDRVQEYGTAAVADYEGRGGARAAAYQKFVIGELLPQLAMRLGIEQFATVSFGGFSMGGLSALDTVWNHPDVFSMAGVFSGSLWWRTRALDAGYNEETDRIMHQQIKEGNYKKGLKFYFTTGSLDETADRNNNGIIDSIDDTLDLITELKKLGYEAEREIRYLNFEDGRHDVATWGRALPQFLEWGWGGIVNGQS